jgi:hypothetical protein
MFDDGNWRSDGISKNKRLACHLFRIKSPMVLTPLTMLYLAQGYLRRENNAVERGGRAVAAPARRLQDAGTAINKQRTIFLIDCSAFLWDIFDS